MKDRIRSAADSLNIGGVALAATVALSLAIDAQAQAQPPDIEKLVKYAQCIRANGYPEFPDPSPDGRMQLKLDRTSGSRFEAAQRACKDQLPPGMPAGDQNVTPERMQKLLAFAACVRERGVKGFPDPSPKGVFEITGAAPDLSTPQVRQALEGCTESHPPGQLSIRRIQAR